MRKLYGYALLFALLLLAACSNDDFTKPEERLEEYTNYWQSEEFDNMYEMIQEDADKEEFDRYPKIYEDLGVSNLTIDYELPNEEEEVDLKEVESVSYPLTVSMDTIAGPISFDTTIDMLQIETTIDDEETIDWVVDWNPGLIFPELEDGGTIGIDRLEPVRGQIFDRNDQGLAINDTVYEIGIAQEWAGDDFEQEKEDIADALDTSVEAIDNKLSAGWVTEDVFVPLRTVATIDDDLQEELEAIPSFTKQETVGRLYPLGEAAAHLIGYVAPITAEKMEEIDDDTYSDNDLIGYRGLEELLEPELRGQGGVVIYVNKDDDESVVLAEQEVKDGKDIHLTIDADVHEELFHSFDGDAGTATAIDPKTGETIALVSSPSFDPHPFLYGLSTDQWDEWQEDPNQPLLNRFASTYAPGSSFKPITSAIGLANDTIDPNEGLTINGLTWQKDGWGDYSVRRVSESNGPVDLKDALVRSDNIYFAMQALNMGEDAFITGLNHFGIGEDFPFTYPIQSGSISSDGSLSSEVLLADTSYGQGQIELSALQLATSYTALLNDGDVAKPILLSDEESETWKEDVVSTDDAAIILDALRGVVTDGTGKPANVSGLNISGKTGTAELKQSLDEEGAAENGWFVGFPGDNSMIITMMVEHIEDQDGGSGYVAEKVGNVFSEIK
ncbi:penicillin-binding transpeptidase domain-containing protein [Gracilibacillus sp. S3-1-1]|uniref:Penicillin-binding transpeptidase domain-containing protein n=1 Tax=Gracilibacillus pellucidus TaxID=3095368 RepID=A0ACC6M0X4_9BACI|nr:penicillin-binding transpeptidase domain-containing protein [Gracilibacillus sp. S3-1-1]MDX8044584.1 penicillin-binding transpeptidase domain-containing protein [Gracilibacillus sp. S3-1-1]